MLAAGLLSSTAANVRNYFLNPQTGLVDTNYLIITPISTNILASGGVIGRGVPIRVPRSPYTNFLVGFYSVSNVALRAAYVINADDPSTTLYDYTNLLHSGYNTYVVKEPTAAGITNALGYKPQPASANLTNWSLLSTNSLSAGSATNAVSRIETNGAALLASGVTNINFVAGANTTVTGAVSGATAVIGISSSGAGSATNVFFHPGQSTTWRTLGGSNVVDVTGTLTNPIANAASNYFGGRVSFGDGSFLALSNGATIYNSISQYNGDYIMTDAGSEFIGTHRGDGQYLTNVPNANLTVFTNITEMVSSPYTNRIAYLTGRWGSNSWGNGVFRHTASAESATNLGTEFLSAFGGYWHRLRPSTNQWRLDWFGLRPINPDSPATIYDGTEAVTNCLAAANYRGEIIVPPFMFATRQIDLTNVSGLTIRAESESFGQVLNFGLSSVPYWCYIGATNGTQLSLFSCQNVTIKGIGFDADTPIHTSLGQITNHALASIVFDQGATWSQISTANRVLDCRFNASRNTNVSYYAIRIAPTSANNCEEMIVENCSGVSRSYYDGSGGIHSLANDAFGIYIGNSANARGHHFHNNSWSGFRYRVWMVNGAFTETGGAKLGGGSEHDYRLDTWTGPTEIAGVFTEGSKSFLRLGTGATSAGTTYPLIVRNCASETSGNRAAAVPLVSVSGNANLTLEGNVLTGPATQIVFDVTNTATANLYSSGNVYPTNEVTVLGLAGFKSGRADERLLFGGNTYRGAWWNDRGADLQIHPAGLTNVLAWHWRGSTIQMNPTNGTFFLGNPASTEAAEKFVIKHEGSGNYKGVIWSDDLIRRRTVLDYQSGGASYWDHHSTNSGQPAAFRLFNDTVSSSTPVWTLSAGSSATLRYDGVAAAILKQNNTIVSFGTDTTITLQPTNGSVIVLTNLQLGNATTAGRITHHDGEGQTVALSVNAATDRWSLNGSGLEAGVVIGSFVGSGSLITNANATTLFDSGTIPPVRLATNSSANGAQIVATSTSTAKWYFITNTFGIVLDGGGAAIATGTSKKFWRAPNAGKIVGVSVLSDVSGSIVVDVWKDTYANHPPTVADTITASAKPTLSSASKSEDVTLTGWTTAFAAGDEFTFNVDSVTALTNVSLQLFYLVQ